MLLYYVIVLYFVYAVVDGCVFSLGLTKVRADIKLKLNRENCMYSTQSLEMCRHVLMNINCIISENR